MSTGASGAARRLLPYTLLPLSLIACVLANVPWLRAFPASVLAVPLFGAAVLSVLIPVVVIGIGVRRLWLSALIDATLLVFYELFVVLREPAGYDQLWAGLVHGPAQILSFALPLVSPRTLLVAPVALCWLSGALIGEFVARAWHSVLPYLTLLVTFGLAYAATTRAVTSAADGRRYDTLFAATLLIALLLLRSAQAWVAQDASAEPGPPEGALPIRALAAGTVVAVAVAAAAAGAVQASAFSGQATVAARVPPVDESRPLTPIAFVSDLRPTDPRDKGQLLFTVNTDRASSAYLAIASLDFYDGDSWSFSRTFRPSGGVVPADPDPAMRPAGRSVTQQYAIADGPMTTVPWMPHFDRPRRVSGVSVDIDATSGMIVPGRPLRAGDTYTVTSAVPARSFTELRATALAGTSASPLDTALPNGLATPLSALVTALVQETGVAVDSPVAFLQAVAHQLRTEATLAGGPAPSRSPTPSPTAESRGHAGGTTFADVLASIRGSRAGTPEQFATFVALLARELDVPARVVSGFRLPAAGGSGTAPAGTYEVTSADAWTWVEIPIRRQGWVVLDAAPSTYSNRAVEPTGGTPVSPSPSPTPSQNALVNQSDNGGHAVAPPSGTSHAREISTVAVVVIVLASLLVAVLLVTVALLARKRARLRHRRRGDPRRRLVGAWQESVDVLVEAGLADLSCATTSEVTAAARARFGDAPAERARAIGAAADVAIFKPGAAIEADDAADAWRAHAALRREVCRALPWRTRLAAGLRYNRPHRPSRTRLRGSADRSSDRAAIRHRS